MGFLGAFYIFGVAKSPPLPPYTYLTMMKFGTVILCLKKTEKKDTNSVTQPLSSNDIMVFFVLFFFYFGKQINNTF